MAITWGTTEGNLRVGIDIVTTSNTATSVKVEVRWYVGSVVFGFADNQTLNFSGSVSGSASYYASSGWGQTVTWHVHTHTFTWTKQYGGGPTYTFTGRVSGNDASGSSPRHTRTYTVPARAPSAPNAPGTPSAGTITGTSVGYSWTASSQTNGASITGYQLVLSRFSDFRSYDYNTEANNRSRTASGLTPGTTYYARVRSRNSAGYSNWSGTRVATTKNYPSAPGTPSISGIQPQSATAAWSAPSSNGGEAVTNYQVQIATSSNFSGASSYSTGTTRSRIFTGLQPGTTYYVRVRAQNAVGYGGWSGTRSFSTLSGAKIRVGGAWVDGVANVRVSGQWRLAVVNKRSGGSWVL